MSSTKQARMYKLVAKLKRCIPVNAENFAKEMNDTLYRGDSLACNARTVRRYIAELRKVYMLELPYDSVGKTYYLSEKDELILNANEISFGSDEIFASGLALKMFHSFFPEDISCMVSNTLDRLISSSEEDAERNSLNAFAVIETRNEEYDPRLFSQVYDAWIYHHCINITLKEAEEEFTFEPHLLALVDGVFYIKGFSYTRGVEIIRLSNIESAEETDNDFVEDPKLIQASVSGDFFKTEYDAENNINQGVEQ